MSGQDIRKVLKLSESTLSVRQIAKIVDIHYSTVSRWLTRAKELKLDFKKASDIEDEDLHDLVNRTKGPKPQIFFPVDVEAICEKIDQGRLSITQAYYQYCEEAERSDLKTLQRSGFFRRVKNYWDQTYGKKGRVMVQEWEPGQYLLIDYAGDKIILTPDSDGLQYSCRIFVCVLPFSRMIFCHATPDATTESWIRGLQEAFQYFGGIPSYIIPDNDAALVSHAEKGNQSYNKIFTDFLNWYEIAVSPARVAHPQDKGLVEEAVKEITYRFIKDIEPGSLNTVDEVNFLLLKTVEEFNNSVMHRYKISRRKWFELEQPKLRPLPKGKFFRGYPLEQRKVKCNGCIEYDTHEYLMPPAYFGKRVGVYVKDGKILQVVELLHNKLICEYEYCRSREPHILEGFTHIKPEYRLPGELTPAGRLEKASEQFCKLSEKAPLFLKEYLRINSHSEKGELASRVKYMIKKLKDVSRDDLDKAFIHVIEVGIFEKDAFLSCVNAFKQGVDGLNKTPKGNDRNNINACLRTFEDLFGHPSSKTSQ